MQPLFSHELNARLTVHLSVKHMNCDRTKENLVHIFNYVKDRLY